MRLILFCSLIILLSSCKQKECPEQELQPVCEICNPNQEAIVTLYQEQLKNKEIEIRNLYESMSMYQSDMQQWKDAYFSIVNKDCSVQLSTPQYTNDIPTSDY